MYNVLIADDEIEVREGLKLKVDWQASGFQITGEAANGLEAESLLKAGHYDLLITDMSMPVMDGVKLLDVCRSYIPDIRIMIITGYEDFQYARAGVRSQAADYLLKPVTRDDLKSALERIKASLDKERKVRDESEMMQWRLSQYYQEMKGRFLMDLVRGDRIPPPRYRNASACFIWMLGRNPKSASSRRASDQRVHGWRLAAGIWNSSAFRFICSAMNWHSFIRRISRCSVIMPTRLRCIALSQGDFNRSSPAG